MLVCDRERPTGIAGIMGGQVSEVSEATTRVLLEVATWNGPNILRTSAMLGLRSEASARNEKGLHPELALRAQRIASRLLVELCGAKSVPGTIDVAADVPPAHVISLHGSRVDALLGIEVERAESEQHLSGLGFEVETEGEADLTATVPLHRHYDVTREVDLIEEVGRLHGLDRLPRTLPEHAERVGGLSREQSIRRRAEDLMRDLGFDEIVAWAFVDAGLAERLRLPGDDPRRPAVAVQNPISEELRLMRTTLLGGLLDGARHNLARGAERVALFESGRAYLAEPAPTEGGALRGHFAGRIPAPVREPHRLAGLVVGALRPPSWLSADANPDAAGFFSLKGVLELLAVEIGTTLGLTPHPEPFLHPGRAAAVGFGGAQAGWLGELHPLVSRAWDLPGAVAFELDLAPLAMASGIGAETYEDVTTHPAVLQDLAVTVADDVSAERVRDAIRAGGGSLLERAEIFDLYRGSQLEPGTKSLALRLEFRAPDRTLTDDEVAAQRERIKDALAEIGGSIRE